MHFKKKIPTLRSQIGIKVIPKNEETKSFLSHVANTKVYVKEGMIFRETPTEVRCLGTINEAWKELERVSDILR